jgi:hypothetical protein
MSIIKCNELLYIRRSVPDVTQVETFLNRFGLITCAEQGESVNRVRPACWDSPSWPNARRI